MKRLLVLLVIACAACELEDVELADSRDIVIAEMYLRTDRQTQLAILHRTRASSDSTAPVPGARIEVTAASGAVMRFVPAPDSACVTTIQQNRITGASCYMSDPAQRFDVHPGERYSARILLPDGGQLTGVTTVPSDFRVVRPADAICALPAGTQMDIVWTSSPDAWAYPSEIQLRGIRRILEEQHGVIIDRDPLRLFGLAISSTDTTIAFPREFGLFDRFNDDLTEALVVLQQGLPSGVVVDVVIAAGDRNYINWERGGNFNPSGVIRIGNLRGDGAGVFGSIVPKHFQVRIGSRDHPPC